MASLKNIISRNSGMRFMVEDLVLCSAAGRRLLLGQEMMTDAQDIEASLIRLDQAVKLVKDIQQKDKIDNLQNVLSQLHDIRGTLLNLTNNIVLDDIGLFEIKHFCLLSEAARHHLSEIGFSLIPLPDLSHVISMLDPDDQKLPQFYIYPAYSPALDSLRKRQQQVIDSDPDQAAILRFQCLELEDSIRQSLSVRLFSTADKLKQSHDTLALLDILFAKALQAHNWMLCRPASSNTQTSYMGLFNPYIKHGLELQRKSFQAVDINLESSPVIITGANMAGKTVLLKSAALAQYLFQFGFYVPAASASIVPVDDILFSMGEEQSELNGLSSFAAEMLNVNAIIQSARSGKNILALFDEPARTTNPEEGRAIVNALIAVLAGLGIRSLITTHYSNITTSCRKLRVKGLDTGRLTVGLTLENINEFMDYSLIEHENDDVPHEAIRIAAILGVDTELIEKAGDELSKHGQ